MKQQALSYSLIFLFQDFTSSHNVDALLHLVQALTGKVVNGLPTVVRCLLSVVYSLYSSWRLYPELSPYFMSLVLSLGAVGHDEQNIADIQVLKRLVVNHRRFYGITPYFLQAGAVSEGIVAYAGYGLG